LFSIVAKKNGEECFELLHKWLFLEKLFKRLGIQKFSRVWVFESWQNPTFVGLSCFLDLIIPSGEQIFDITEELMMELL
jgi:hypothetical protein